MGFKNVILLFHDINKIKLSVATPKEVEYAKNKYKKVDKSVLEKYFEDNCDDYCNIPGGRGFSQMNKNKKK